MSVSPPLRRPAPCSLRGGSGPSGWLVQCQPVRGFGAPESHKLCRPGGCLRGRLSPSDPQAHSMTPGPCQAFRTSSASRCPQAWGSLCPLDGADGRPTPDSDAANHLIAGPQCPLYHWVPLPPVSLCPGAPCIVLGPGALCISKATVTQGQASGAALIPGSEGRAGLGTL